MIGKVIKLKHGIRLYEYKDELYYKFPVTPYIVSELSKLEDSINSYLYQEMDKRQISFELMVFPAESKIMHILVIIDGANNTIVHCIPEMNETYKKEKEVYYKGLVAYTYWMKGLTITLNLKYIEEISLHELYSVAIQPRRYPETINEEN